MFVHPLHCLQLSKNAARWAAKLSADGGALVHQDMQDIMNDVEAMGVAENIASGLDATKMWQDGAIHEDNVSTYFEQFELILSFSDAWKFHTCWLWNSPEWRRVHSRRCLCQPLVPV